MARSSSSSRKTVNGELKMSAYVDAGVGNVSEKNPAHTEAVNYFNSVESKSLSLQPTPSSTRNKKPPPEYQSFPQPPKKIAQIQFSLLSPGEMQRLSEIKVTSRNLFTMPSRKPR